MRKASITFFIISLLSVVIFGSYAHAQSTTPLSLTPLEDTHVKESSPNNNYGNNTILETSDYSNNNFTSYLKFDLAAASGKQITEATLKLTAALPRRVTKSVKLVSDTSWSESTMNFNTAPQKGQTLGSIQNVSLSTGQVVDIPLDANALTPYVGNLLTLALDNNGTGDTLQVNSSENSTGAPQLILTVAGTSTHDPDVNRDGIVDVQDARQIIRQYLSTSGPEDVNHDGIVNSFDFAIVVHAINNPALPSPSPNPQVSASPSPTASPAASPAVGELPPEYIKVDPNSDTDEYANNFIKNRIFAGDQNVIAVGAWWGPTDKFFENQVWLVARNIQTGLVYQPGESIPISYTCLLPGKLPGQGTANNTLENPIVHQQIQVDSSNTTNNSNPVLEQYWNTSQRSNSSGSHEIRIVCETDETEDNNFGDGTAIAGERIRLNLDPWVWIGSKPPNLDPGTLRNTNANHSHVDILYEGLDMHTWYTDTEYVWTSLDGACNNGPCQSTKGNMDNNQIINATISGDFTVYETILNSKFDAGPIHHVEMRIEHNGEDYTVPGTKQHSPISGSGLDIRRQRIGYTLNTREIPDGWHIVSLHHHILDKTNTSGKPQKFGKQQAGEFKIPVCIKNNQSTNCP